VQSGEKVFGWSGNVQRALEMGCLDGQAHLIFSPACRVLKGVRRSLDSQSGASSPQGVECNALRRVVQMVR